MSRFIVYGMLFALSLQICDAQGATRSTPACAVVSSAPALHALCSNYARHQCPQNSRGPGCQGLSDAFFRVSGGQRIESLFTDSVSVILPTTGAFLVLPDVVEVGFPPDAFETEQLITIERVRLPSLASRIAGQPDLAARAIAPYQVTISTGSRQPRGLEIFLSLRIPDDWVPSPANQSAFPVMLLESRSDLDVRHSFEHIVSVERFHIGWLDMSLPMAAFIKNDQGTYVATLSLVLNDTPPPTPGQCFPLLAPLGELDLRADTGFWTDPTTGEARWHAGNDYAAPLGTDILAPADGVVAYSGALDADTGNMLLIRHARGWTQYLHMLEPSLLRANDPVIRGQIIGKVGSSGNSSAPHLHFEFKSRSLQRLDPSICYILGGTWNGSYSWDCDRDQTGATEFSATIAVLGHDRFRTTLTYLGQTLDAQAFIGPLAPDESMPVTLVSPGSDSIAFNVFEGVLEQGFFMRGTTLNGDSPAISGQPGCSAIQGPSGTWSLQK